MNAKEIIKNLEIEIERLEDDKAEYYADNGTTDGYVMSLVGQIKAYKKVIDLLK